MGKKNKVKIKGDNNVNLTDIKDSDISVGEKNLRKRKSKFWIIAGVVIAFIALIVQVLVGWDTIINFLYAGQNK